MFRFLHSIFSGTETRGKYPESLVEAAIERAVDSTDPWLRGVSGYKKKLRPAVLTAIDHVVALVDKLPPALDADPARYGDDPLLKAFFMSTADMKKVLGGDRALAEFLRGAGRGCSRVTALLMMEKCEGVMIGAEVVGDIVLRDVPQVTVSFEGHRLVDPSGDEQETRRLLMRRAFDHLLSLALRFITMARSERDDLERRRALLQAKLTLLQRGGWSFDTAGAGEVLSVAQVEEQLGTVEGKLEGLGGDDRTLDIYLGIVADVLGRPGEQLWGGSETVIIDRLGIKRSESAFDAPELTLTTLYNAEGRSLVVTLVALSGETLSG